MARRFRKRRAMSFRTPQAPPSSALRPPLPALRPSGFVRQCPAPPGRSRTPPDTPKPARYPRPVIDLFSQITRIVAAGGSVALCTVVHSAGSSPQKAGSKMLVLPGGELRGTIGGGAIEAAVIEQAHEALAEGRARLFKAHLTRDLAMCCGGRMEIFIEPIGNRPWLVVFGGGHVGQALVSVATTAGFRVHLVDGREGFAEADRHPAAAAITADDPLAALPDLPWSPSCSAVIVTHDHQLDEQLLKACLLQEWAYLGMIGSRAKVERFRKRLLARGVDPDRLAAVRAPIGLAIGAREPGEIAVSIVAELVAVRHSAAEARPLTTLARAPT
jgi:xanthine dehydrogenase accessory factor